MIHHSTKFHATSLSQFLALHSTSPKLMPSTIDMDNTGSNQSSLEAISGSIGKSFTIAAILGLKKNAAAMEHHHHNHHQLHGHHHHHHHHHIQHGNAHKDYAAVMNLSINQQNVKNCLNDNFDAEHNGCSRLPTVLSANQHLSTNHHGANALQSLQHLHQQHSASGISFQGRERSKNDQHSAKKSALKNKRVRTIFTPEQLERLESEFERQQYMVGPERLYLAHTLQLTEAQVKVWFQNRRIKWRKHHLEITQQKLALIRQRQVPGTTSEMQQQIHPPPESELSVCTDSMDTGSIHDGDL